MVSAGDSRATTTAPTTASHAVHAAGAANRVCREGLHVDVEPMPR